jgi:hypothetical protein
MKKDPRDVISRYVDKLNLENTEVEGLDVMEILINAENAKDALIAHGKVIGAVKFGSELTPARAH